MKNYRKQANELASKGRYGDDTLVHMNQDEVAALNGIASLAGRSLTKNPDTGMPEAFNLFDILPFALNFIFPGMGTAAQIGIGALSGAAGAAVEGEDPLTAALTGGLMSGVGGALFGGSGSLDPAAAQLTEQASSLGAAFGGKTGYEEVMKQAAAAQAASPGPGFWDTDTTMRSFGPETGVGKWMANPLSDGNLPYTLAGGAAAASLLGNGNLFGTEDEGPEEIKPNLRYADDPIEYRPFTGDYSTYGQTGGNYQNEVNTFFDETGVNPGFRLGDPYTGDPADYKPFRHGGHVTRFADGGQVELAPVVNSPFFRGIADRAAAWENSPQNTGQLSGIKNRINQLEADGQIPPTWQYFLDQARGGMDAARARAMGAGTVVTPTQQVSTQAEPMNPITFFQNRFGGGTTITPQSTESIGGKRSAGRAGGGAPIRGRQADRAPVRLEIPRAPAQSVYAPGNVVAGPSTSQAPIMNPTLFRAPVGFAGGGGISSLPGQMDQSVYNQLRDSRYISGDEAGMADSVPAEIDGQQPAALSHGEFVVPADVVSMLGDGNSNAGAQVLRGMIERVRVQKTGRPEQAPEILPEEVMPA